MVKVTAANVDHILEERGSMTFWPARIRGHQSNEGVLKLLRAMTLSAELCASWELWSRILTSAAVSSCVSTRGRPLAFFAAASSLLACVLERFLGGACPSLSELPILAHAHTITGVRSRSCQPQSIKQSGVDREGCEEDRGAESCKTITPGRVSESQKACRVGCECDAVASPARCMRLGPKAW